jgi:hypothetical protein
VLRHPHPPLPDVRARQVLALRPVRLAAVRPAGGDLVTWVGTWLRDYWPPLVVLLLLTVVLLSAAVACGREVAR